MEIDEGMIYYPGNPRPEIEQYRKIPEESTTESRICIGSHTGTHVDAPEHIQEEGATVEELDLKNFYGEAQVLNLKECREKVDREDLEKTEIKQDIILLKTDNSSQGYGEFRKNFTYLTLEAVEYLIEKGVKTVGIDYLSLVEFDGGRKANKAHKKANQEMTVIEGLKLSDVEADTYTFSGIPLKMKTDGSPMRAVLIQN